MAVIPLRKDQPTEPLRKRRVTTMTGFEDHCAGPIEMIAASDGSVELLCRKKAICVEGQMLNIDTERAARSLRSRGRIRQIEFVCSEWSQ